jgi:hypothetical protein
MEKCPEWSSPARVRRSIRAASTVLGLALLALPSFGLDKQGSAHGGDVAGADDGVDVSGSATLGLSLYNPSYAARPDNTGRVLFRYALHSDFDLIGRRLSIPLDLNVFTDRKRDGAKALLPTEMDVINGLTTTWPLGPGALEVGARFEHDRQVGPTLPSEVKDVNGQVCDHGGLCSQTYVDARTRYLYSLASAEPDVGKALANGDVSGWLTLGYFVINPSYAARPDNSGSALLRYAVHTELSIFDDLVSFGVDGTMFTDRHAQPFLPSELDLTPEIIFHRAPIEVHLAYERDMPIGSSAADESSTTPGERGLVQSFVYLLFVWSFDLRHSATAPLEERTQVPSP